MKKLGKGLLSLAFAILVLFGVQDVARAGEAVLYTNDNWVSGSIDVEGEADFYTVNLPSAGYLSVTYQGWSIGDGYCSLLSEDMASRYWRYEVYTSSDINPKTRSEGRWLEAGAYIVKVEGDRRCTGTYKVKAKFTPAKNNEKEPNNTFNAAMKLGANQLVTGLLSEDDNTDFYTFTLSQKKTLLFSYLGYIRDSYFEIWDENYISIYRKDVYYGSETSPKSHVYEVTLNPGTYFVKITPYGGNTGRYSLKYINVIKVSGIKVSGNKQVVAGKKFKLSASVSPSSATNKAVSYSTDNSSVATVDANTGVVTTCNPGTAHIRVSALDGGGASKSVTVVVKPKKDGRPNVYKSYSYTRKYQISCKYQSYVYGHQVQYSTDKKFRNATTKTTTNGSIYTKSLKAKKKYYVRTRSYILNGKKKVYGAWSSTASFTAK